MRRIDAAWPGDHTRQIYDDLSKRQANILTQLRTDITPLTGIYTRSKQLERIVAIVVRQRSQESTSSFTATGGVSRGSSWACG